MMCNKTATRCKDIIKFEIVAYYCNLKSPFLGHRLCVCGIIRTQRAIIEITAGFFSKKRELLEGMDS